MTATLFTRIKDIAKVTNSRSLGMTIFFVTSHCNARCLHCFNWQNINRPSEDLTLEEIKKLTLSMPHFPALLFSGGEPFLREELYDIFSLFYNNVGVRTFTFPTNGSLPERIERDITRIMADFPEAHVSATFSVDGLASDHDRMRQLPGCFLKVRQSIERLRPLKKRFGSRLEIKTNTVISAGNIGGLAELISFLENEYADLDDHLFEILRGNPKDQNLRQKITDRQLTEIYRDIRRHKEKMLSINKTPIIDSLFKLANLILIQTIQQKGYLGKGWGMPCFAGQTMAVIDHNGDVRHCELRGPVGNLRDYGMDFNEVWRSERSDRERENIRIAKCWNGCTHVCFVADAIYRSYLTYFFRVPFALLKSAGLILRSKIHNYGKR